MRLLKFLNGIFGIYMHLIRSRCLHCLKETMNDIKNAIEPCSGSHLDRIFVVMDIVCIVDTGNRLVETQSQGYIFSLYFYLIILSIP